MKFNLHQESRIGGRRENQDRMVSRSTRDAVLLVVADGMGGHAHGEVAAQVCVNHIAELFDNHARPRLPDPFIFLALALERAHSAIGQTALAADLEEVPRTTCVACVIQDGIAHWAHAGDSRLYLLRGDAVFARTLDHSSVRLLVEQGVIDEEAARHHPNRNRVFSCLGGAMPPQVEFSRKTPLLPGDVLALCSDGAWGPLDEAAFVHTLVSAAPPLAVPQLLDAAEAAAGPRGDNLTLIALRWEEASSPETRLLAGESPSDEDIERAVDEIRGMENGK
ncbi:MAG TPA: PP2C family serine/threonine-protein phosphatase [Rhodocyclaceae bacterium]